MNYMGSPVKPGTTPLRYVLLHSCLWFRICLDTFHLNRAAKFENVPLGYMRSAMSQIRLRTYGVWSRPSLFAYTFIACCRIWSCIWFCLKHQGSPGILTWSQLAFYVNLHRAVIGPSATLTGRWRPDIDLRRMQTGDVSIESSYLSL